MEFYDYSKRGCLLPDGCKDLTYMILPKTAITKREFVVTARLPGIQNKDIEIVAEGSALRITIKQSGAPVSSVARLKCLFQGNTR